MNLLKTDEVFFIGLATTAAVKKQKKKTKSKQSIIKNIMIRSNMKNKKKKTNYKTTIYQNRYVLHPDSDSWWLRSKLPLFKFTMLGKKCR